MRGNEHLYVVGYDVRDPKRWRRLYRAMKGRGEWLQLSVFQCRLSRMGFAELTAVVEGIIKHDEDHVVVLDLGPAESVRAKVRSLGRPFDPIERRTIIV